MANQVKLTFNKKHEGLLLSQTSKTNISFKGEGFEPYELFLGGYASCLHATFLGIARKKRIELDDVYYDVYATKREEVPTTLNYVKTTFIFIGVKEGKQKAVIKSMELAEKYCSISAMINMVATMEFEYVFK